MDLGDLFGVVVTFVAIGVLLSFGLNIQGTIKNNSAWYGISGCNSTTVAGCGAEYNASQSAINANANVATNLPILGTITIAAIVIGVLVKAFVL